MATVLILLKMSEPTAHEVLQAGPALFSRMRTSTTTQSVIVYLVAWKPSGVYIRNTGERVGLHLSVGACVWSQVSQIFVESLQARSITFFSVFLYEVNIRM